MLTKTQLRTEIDVKKLCFEFYFFKNTVHENDGKSATV